MQSANNFEQRILNLIEDIESHFKPTEVLIPMIATMHVLRELINIYYVAYFLQEEKNDCYDDFWDIKNKIENLFKLIGDPCDFAKQSIQKESQTKTEKIKFEELIPISQDAFARKGAL
jgi:hypothetical protein